VFMVMKWLMNLLKYIDSLAIGKYKDNNSNSNVVTIRLYRSRQLLYIYAGNYERVVYYCDICN
jgi:hypothetical protein